MNSSTKNISIFIFIISLMLACNKKQETLPYYNTPDFEPVWNPCKEMKLHSIPAFSFTNQSNQKITDKNLERKITIVNFIFTTCGGICPDMTRNLRVVLDTFASDNLIQFQSYSVKPWEDSVTRLKEFADIYSLNEKKWNLLTGDKATIYELARKAFFAEEDAGYNKDSTEFLHTENVLLIDKNKHIRGLYKGTLPLDMQHLITDINILKKEN